MAASYTVVFLCLVGVGGFLLLRRTKGFWLRLLFPLAYLLYSRTRLGYHLHLWQLNKRRGASPHSITQPLPLSGAVVVPVAIIEDNYSYLIIDPSSKRAVAVDPSDPTTVKQKVEDRGVSLCAILTTHKHWDHAGGNEVLKREFRGLEVYGSAKDSVAGMTHQLQDGDTVNVGQLSFRAVLTPGHTVGHMVYLLQSKPPCLFSGDHIFIGGNGQMFELGPEKMLQSIKKVMELPTNTLIFPGHEYSLGNLQFASSLLPSNLHIQNKLQWVRQQRLKKLSTVPSLLSEELRYNLFMCTSSRELLTALGLPPHTPEPAVLAELRRQLLAYRGSIK